MADMDDKERREDRRKLRDEFEAAYRACATFPQELPDGWARLIHLRSLVPDVLLELSRDLPPRKVDPKWEPSFKFD